MHCWELNRHGGHGSSTGDQCPRNPGFCVSCRDWKHYQNGTAGHKEENSIRGVHGWCWRGAGSCSFTPGWCCIFWLKMRCSPEQGICPEKLPQAHLHSHIHPHFLPVIKILLVFMIKNNCTTKTHHHIIHMQMWTQGREQLPKPLQILGLKTLLGIEKISI